MMNSNYIREKIDNLAKNCALVTGLTKEEHALRTGYAQALIDLKRELEV